MVGLYLYGSIALERLSMSAIVMYEKKEGKKESDGEFPVSSGKHYMWNHAYVSSLILGFLWEFQLDYFKYSYFLFKQVINT